MKKVWSLILTAVLLLALFTVTASAQDNDWTDKLSDYLQYEITIRDPDKTVGVSIKFANIEVAEMDAILESLGIETIRYCSGKNPYAIVNVTFGQIPEIAQNPNVSHMYMMSPLSSGEGTLCYVDEYLEYLDAQQFSIYQDDDLSVLECLYDEVYIHTDENSETDWVLLLASTGFDAPWIYHTLIGNREIVKDGFAFPFSADYGLYDVKKDRFFDVNNENMNGKNFKPGDYPGFAKIFDQIAAQSSRFQSTRLIGDLDSDGEITVIDATLIQRCNAKMRDYPEDDDSLYLDISKPKPAYYSDFNRDGERNILDATVIQRYLLDL